MHKARSMYPPISSLFLSTCILSLLIALPALGEAPTCVINGIADKTGMATEDIELAELAHQPIFIDGSAGLETGDILTFDIRVDGSEYLREEVELLAAESASEEARTASKPVIELLAANNPRLGHLYRLAQGHGVEVAIQRNGQTLETIDFHELVARSEELRQEPIEPRALRSTILEEKAASGPQQKDACTDYCDDEQDDCYFYRCGQFGSASCYDACDRDWIDCLEGCGQCVPSSSTSTSLSIVSTTPTGITECRYDFFFGKGYYNVFDRRIKRTVTTTTTNSDCTQTVSTQVSYFNIYCWSFWFPNNYCFSLGNVPQLC